MSEQPEYPDYDEEYDEQAAQEYQEYEQEYEFENEPPALAQRQAQHHPPRLLDSWPIRLLLTVIVIVGVGAIIIGGAYLQASSTRDEPLEVKAFPGMLQANYEKIDTGHDLQTWSGTVALAELENHYKKQMDECNRLFRKPEEGEEQADQTIESIIYVRTTCLLDHSHDLFSIMQYVRLTIEPEFDKDGNRTGPVNVTIERVWKE